MAPNQQLFKPSTRKRPWHLFYKFKKKLLPKLVSYYIF